MKQAPETSGVPAWFKERKVKRIMFNKNDKKMRTVSIVIVVLICASMVIGTAAAGLSAFLH